MNKGESLYSAISQCMERPNRDKLVLPERWVVDQTRIFLVIQDAPSRIECRTQEKNLAVNWYRRPISHYKKCILLLDYLPLDVDPENLSSHPLLRQGLFLIYSTQGLR